VRLGRKKLVTKTKFKTLHPEWRQRFEFALMDFGGREATELIVEVCFTHARSTRRAS